MRMEKYKTLKIAKDDFMVNKKITRELKRETNFYLSGGETVW